MVILTNPEMESICQALSPDRLAPFLAATKTLSDALELYSLNITLCKLMYPSLNTLEITLRNAIDQVLSDHYGKDWLINKQFFLDSYEADTLEKELNKLKKSNPSVSQAQLIAKLSLGFWVAFFNKKYEESFWRPYNKHIFPYAIARQHRDIKRIRPILKNILHLRNRVFHHEPIWKKHEELPYTIDNIYGLVSFINPKIVHWIREIDKFKKKYTEELEDRLEYLIIRLD